MLYVDIPKSNGVVGRRKPNISIKQRAIVHNFFIISVILRKNFF